MDLVTRVVDVAFVVADAGVGGAGGVVVVVVVVVVVPAARSEERRVGKECRL